MLSMSKFSDFKFQIPDFKFKIPPQYFECFIDIIFSFQCHLLLTLSTYLSVFYRKIVINDLVAWLVGVALKMK